MTGRHRRTRLTALDGQRFQSMTRAFHAVLDHPEGLVRELAGLPPSAEAPADSAAWRRAPELLKVPLLVGLLPSDPPRWAPMLVAALVGHTSHPLPTRWITDLCATTVLDLEDAYRVLVYFCDDYRLRFVPPDRSSPEFVDGPKALWDALGGHPDPEEPDLRWCLRDSQWPVEEVTRIAAGLSDVTVPTLPPIRSQPLTVAPDGVADTVQRLATFFGAAAAASEWVDVKWHAHPFLPSVRNVKTG